MKVEQELVDKSHEEEAIERWRHAFYVEERRANRLNYLAGRLYWAVKQTRTCGLDDMNAALVQLKVVLENFEDEIKPPAPECYGIQNYARRER